MKKKSIFVKVFLFTALLILYFSNYVYATSPLLYFSDIVSGPDTGLGDGRGSGAIVTIWGKNLGGTQGNNNVFYKDSGGTSRVAAYVYYWGNADAKGNGGPSDLYTYWGMQEIAFSIPDSAIGKGKIYVTVGGINTNELDFTVRSGNIYFIDASASGTENGSWANPWDRRDDYHDNAKAGDIGYFMGGTYNKAWGHNCLLYEGESPAGTEDMPVAWIAYPGEVAVLSARYGDPENVGGDISDYNWRPYMVGYEPHNLPWYVISKFKMKAWRSCIAMALTGWRIIGNDCDGLNATSQVQAGIVDMGGDSSWVYGNQIHGGRTGDKMDHAIYPGGCPKDGGHKIGWNHMFDNNFGNGPLISINHEGTRCGTGQYVDDCYVNDNVFDCSNYQCRALAVFHMNHQVNEPDSEIPTTHIYNNVFIKCGVDGGNNTGTVICYNGHVKIYNNTFYGCEGNGSNTAAIFCNYGNPDGGDYYLYDVFIKNNIFYVTSDVSEYIYLDYPTYPAVTGTKLEVSNNCYFGKGQYTQSHPNGQDANPINADPLFVNPEAKNFNLQPDSPCIDFGQIIQE